MWRRIFIASCQIWNQLIIIIIIIVVIIIKIYLPRDEWILYTTRKL